MAKLNLPKLYELVEDVFSNYPCYYQTMMTKEEDKNQLSHTAILLNRIVDGDRKAEEELAQYCYPLLLRWAHGRIPYSERSLLETTDLVQESIMKGMQQIGQFESLGAGAFLAYLRKIFINCINESVKKPNLGLDIDDFLNQRTHFSTELDLNEFILYENALNKLNEQEQDAIILRIEFGFTYSEIAKEMGKASEDAARMFVSRALIKLAKHIK